VFGAIPQQPVEPAEDLELLNEDGLSRELLAIRRRRYLEARQDGLTRDESRVVAHDTSLDIGILRKLVKKGASHDQIVSIFL